MQVASIDAWVACVVEFRTTMQFRAAEPAQPWNPAVPSNSKHYKPVVLLAWGF
jgi:hypothetical protein